ncbi:MAG: DUF559 domain-containing protein [Rhodospirillaceae bacterium]|nr:DUF559 domain-containing protein [Rhodospirillaceae bacterium]
MPLYKPDQRTVPIARRLRRDPSMEERRMWDRLRGRRFRGAKFRRQGRIGPYIVDFVCLEARLIVEIDDPLHEHPDQRSKDAFRQGWLEREGFHVIRFTTRECYHNIDRVMEAIAAALAGDGPSPPAPLPRGERGV